MYCRMCKLATSSTCLNMISSERKCGQITRSAYDHLRKPQSLSPRHTNTIAVLMTTTLVRNVVYQLGKAPYCHLKTLLTLRCDRVLYRKCAGIECIDYRRYEPTVSDHKPVSAGFNMKVKSVDKLRMQEVKVGIMEEWSRKEGELLERIMKALPDLL